ncbi:MAG: hypothetical protein R6W76_02750, partial [Caldilinea sp.]
EVSHKDAKPSELLPKVMGDRETEFLMHCNQSESIAKKLGFSIAITLDQSGFLCQANVHVLSARWISSSI